MLRLRFSSLACPLAAFVMLGVAGCIERSTVIKVKKDGSGVVHVRHHGQKVGITIGRSSAPPKEDSDESKMPSQEEIQRMVASMGSGVELVSAEKTTNRNGWDGYELVFQFADINQLLIPDEMTSPPDDADDAEHTDSADASKKPTARGDSESGYRFEMNDGELKIHSLLEGKAAVAEKQPEKIGTVDPFAGEPAATKTSIDLRETAMEQVLAKVLADMRIGVFVEIDGEIASTNAIHRQENLITLVRLNLGKILEDPDAKQHMKSLTDLKNAPNRRQRTQEIAELVDGLDVDAQDPIVVTFR